MNVHLKGVVASGWTWEKTAQWIWKVTFSVSLQNLDEKKSKCPALLYSQIIWADADLCSEECLPLVGGQPIILEPLAVGLLCTTNQNRVAARRERLMRFLVLFFPYMQRSLFDPWPSPVMSLKNLMRLDFKGTVSWKLTPMLRYIVGKLSL